LISISSEEASLGREIGRIAKGLIALKAFFSLFRSRSWGKIGPF